MSAQKSEWPSQILQSLYSQHPYLLLDDAKVVINDLRREENYDETYTGIIYAVAGNNVLQFPFVIKDGYLYPIDIFYDQATDRVMWLTKPNFYKVIFNEHALGQPVKEAPKPEVTFNDNTNAHLVRSYPELVDRTGLVYGDQIGKVVVAHIIPRGRQRVVDIYENMEKRASYVLPRAEVAKLLSLYGLPAVKETIAAGGYITNTVKTAQLSWETVEKRAYEMQLLDNSKQPYELEIVEREFLTKHASATVRNEYHYQIDDLTEGVRFRLRAGNRVTEPLRVTKVAADKSIKGFGILSGIPFTMRVVKTASTGFDIFNTRSGEALIVVGDDTELLAEPMNKSAADEERYYKGPSPDTVIAETANERQVLSLNEFAVKLASHGLDKDQISEVIGKIKAGKHLVINKFTPQVKTASDENAVRYVKQQMRKVAEFLKRHSKLAQVLPEVTIVTNKLEKEINIHKDYKDIDAIVETLDQLIGKLIAIYWQLLTTGDERISVEVVRDAINEIERLRDNLEQFSYVQKYEPAQ